MKLSHCILAGLNGPTIALHLSLILSLFRLVQMEMECPDELGTLHSLILVLGEC